LRRRLRLAILIFAVVVVGAGVYALTRDTVYSAKVTLLPEMETAGGPIGDLVRLNPVSVPGPLARYEDFCEEIIKSDRVLDALVKRRWPYGDRGDSLSLAEILEVEEPADDPRSRAIRDHRLKELMRSRVISFSRRKSTGFMTLTCRMPDPELAASFANALAAELNAYYQSFRRSRATAQRDFIEARLQEVQQDLHHAEERIADFVDRNRSYEDSPALTVEYSRLAREVETQTALWIELRRQYELVKIEEQGDPVSVNILDWATPPPRRSWPRLEILIPVGMLIGLVAALLVVIVVEQVAAGRAARSQGDGESR